MVVGLVAGAILVGGVLFLTKVHLGVEWRSKPKTLRMQPLITMP